MDWTAGFPERFGFLDEEHLELGVMVTALDNAASSAGEQNPALATRRLLKKLNEHISHEEEVMRECAYPELELHQKHHQHVIHSIELILQLFNRKGMAEHGAMIAKHLENKMSEEMFIDRLFAEFLNEQDTRD